MKSLRTLTRQQNGHPLEELQAVGRAAPAVLDGGVADILESFVAGEEP